MSKISAILLALFVVLSLATAGWAGDKPRIMWAPTIPDSATVDRTYESQNVKNLKDTLDCLATMEKAMTSMDRYVKWMILDMELDMDNKEEINRLAQAVKLWTDAKQCWGEQK